MKQFTSILLVALLSILLINCKNKKDATTEAMPDKEEATDVSENIESDVKKVTVERSYHFRETDDYNLDTMWMVKDTLFLKVQYSGGCEDHEFELMSNGAYAKSMPPQMTLHLEHDANNDMCRAMITEELKFDLTPVRNPSSEKLIVRVNGLSIDPVTYTYER